MDLTEWYTQFGYEYLEPWAATIRNYLEGPDAEVSPYKLQRYIEPRDWYMSNHDIATVVILAMLISLFQFVITFGFTKPLHAYLGLRQVDYVRFKESVWQFCFYTPIWLFEFYLVFGLNYYTHTYLMFEPPFPFQEMSTGVFWLYMFQMAWYLHCTFFHLFVDTRKSDFMAMLVHHATTLALLFSAFSSGYFRSGVLCMFCLDACDICLHLCKALRYVENVGKLHPSVMILSYLSMVLSWLSFRILLFPYKVLYATSAQALNYGGWINADYWTFFNILLFIIFLLQVFWFWLILQAGYSFLRYGDEFQDVRDPSVAKKNE